MPKKAQLKKQTGLQIPKDYQLLKGSERRPSAKAKLLGPANPKETFSVTIVLRRRPDGPPLPSFDYFAKTPLSQRRRMPQDEFAAKYGAAPRDIDAVVKFARSHELNIVETHAARRTVVVSGTVAQMSKAFVVALGRYQRVMTSHRGKDPQTKLLQTETYRGRDGFIHIPKNLAEIVVGVFGLDNRRISHPAGGPGDPTVINPVTMQQVTTLYNFPSPGSVIGLSQGIAGQTIGIISPDSGFGGYLQSDLDLYFLSISAPKLQPVSISVDGIPNGAMTPVTIAAALAGQSILTFAPGEPTAGLLVNSVGYYEVASVTYYVLATLVTTTSTATTVSVEFYDTTTKQFGPTGFPTAVPLGTIIYFNMGLSTFETTQDICIAGSAAPGATVAVYFMTDTQAGWVDLIKRVIHPDALDFPAGVNHPSVLSSSWIISSGDDPVGLSDAGITASVLEAMDASFQDAAIQGLTVCNGSGDAGSFFNITDGYAHVAYPSSDPWVLSVGGTTVGKNYPPNSTTAVWVEYIWNDTFFGGEAGATGGGVSDFFPLPSYQNNVGVPQSINLTINPNAPFNAFGRGVPDVAGNASPNTGYYYYVAGLQAVANGTSASAPLWAALVAVINSNLPYNVGYVNPFLYALGSSAFNAITPLWPDPSNPLIANGPSTNSFNAVLGYSAVAGWDPCTGWGSPNGTALLNAWKTQLAQDCYFIVDQPIFGEGAVASELLQSPTAVFDEAFFVVVDGYTPNQLILPGSLSNPTVQPQFSPALPSGMSFVLDTVQPVDAALFASNPDAPQRLTYVYNVQFTSIAGFPVSPVQTLPVTITATVTASVNGNNVTVSSGATLQLDSVPDPYFAGGSGISWLSDDIRVFQVEMAEVVPATSWIINYPPNPPLNTGIPLQYTGDPTIDATNFIQQVIQLFNNPSEPAPPHHPFDLLPTAESMSLDTLPLDPATNNFVFNFAVARVRYDSSAVNAQSVRVFFRLIQALTTASVSYDPSTNYRRWSDGVEFGQAIPLLGIDPTTGDVLTIPFFASPRIDSTQADMTTQTDTPNVQPINAGVGYAYFGCWLDLNQTYTGNSSLVPAVVPLSNPDGPYPLSSLQDISTSIMNTHQCIVAEIAFDPDPIPEGLAPSTSGPLAQRNLSLVPAANPGDAGSRRVPNTFTIRPTSTTLAFNERPDELMIDWGNTPPGSVASIYWPAISAAKVLQMAATMYLTHNLTMSDSHTLQTPVGGITYIPIPPGAGSGIPGLISVDLPFGIRKGQVFNIVVRQVTGAIQPQKTDRATSLPTWRRILGSFQISIPVETKAEMLAPEERLLSLMRWTEKKIPASSWWYSTFKRYVAQIAQRVSGLGGNPGAIPASPTGGAKPPLPPSGKPPHRVAGLEFTGKVEGLKYDRFGDFIGFLFRTEQGEERYFQSREHEIEALAQRAWAERFLITVFAERHDPHRPESIVLRRAP